MKVHNILVALVLSMVASFAFAQTADQCDPEAVKVELDDGKFTCVFGLKPLSPEAAAKKSAREAEELAEKKAAAQAYLEKDVIKITAYFKDYGGIEITAGVELYPEKGVPGKGIMRFRQSGSWCDVTDLKTTFSVTPLGNVLASMESPRYRGCNRIYAEIDPITKKITVQVAPFEGGEKRSGTRWVMDEVRS